jgi:hypothetical protein
MTQQEDGDVGKTMTRSSRATVGITTVTGGTAIAWGGTG